MLEIRRNNGTVSFIDDINPCRNIKELLEILLINIRNGFFKQYGMSGLYHLTLILNLKGDINNNEYHKLFKYIKDNPPKNLQRHIFKSMNLYWFPKREKPRIKWLLKHLNQK